jgi:methylmalonyl-CoA mutase C-terminal domain/subunit
VIECLAQAGREDVLVIVGGIIPEDDIGPLEALGVAHVFTPGAPLPEIGRWLGEALDRREEALGV